MLLDRLPPGRQRGSGVTSLHPASPGHRRRSHLLTRRVCVSSREDRGRYRGRRRAPTPPRSRYAAVVTTAFLGAGVVALGSASAFGDNNAADPATLAAQNASG